MKHNSLYFAQKYTRIFALAYYMFLGIHFFLIINLFRSLSFPLNVFERVRGYR